MGVVQVLLRAVRAYLGAAWAYCGYGAGAATGAAWAVSRAPGHVPHTPKGNFLSAKPLLGAPSVPGDGIDPTYKILTGSTA